MIYIYIYIHFEIQCITSKGLLSLVPFDAYNSVILTKEHFNYNVYVHESERLLQTDSTDFYLGYSFDHDMYVYDLDAINGINIFCIQFYNTGMKKKCFLAMFLGGGGTTLRNYFS